MIRNHHAFTLIELLIVVAIIAILAAIAVPNFLEAQIRAKVSRVKADMASMATAVEMYAVDHNKHPIRRDRWDEVNPVSAAYTAEFDEKIYAPSAPGARVGLQVITTPVGYISSVPRDIFNTPAAAQAQPGNPYSDCLDYWDSVQADRLLRQLNALPSIPLAAHAGRARGYLMYSVGPDQYIGVLDTGLPGDYPPQPRWVLNSINHFYDPTNGSVSRGNIYRFAGGLSQREVLWAF